MIQSRVTISLLAAAMLAACSDGSEADDGAAGEAAVEAETADALVEQVEASPTPEAPRSEYLSKVERQFVAAMRQAELADAAFYVDEGLVDPKDLSTGRTLVSYVYGSGDCDPLGGSCTPYSDTTVYLIENGFDLEQELSYGRRPITFVCWGRSIGENNARLLTQQGVKVNFTDADGVTPLHYCARRTVNVKAGQTSEQWDSLRNTVENLLAAGANINARDQRARPATHRSYREPFYQGSTPLMQAVDYIGEIDWRQFAMIEYLLDKGADASLIDANGFGVANYLRYPDRNRKYEPTLEMLEILHNAGADIMHETPKGQNLFNLAVERGDLEFAKKIRTLSASPRT